MKNLNLKLFLYFIPLLIISCDGLKMPGKIFETSERVKYERSFSGPDSLMAKWKSSFTAAENNRLKINDGYVSSVFADSINPVAVGYSLDLKKGDLLIVETETINVNPKIFVDVIDSLSSEKFESQLVENNKFTKIIENTGSHKIIIQPEIQYTGIFELKIYTQPSVYFPVAGKGNRDVQSFWGASRNGGGRSHEGVDVFAAKGTPVVAISDGFVFRTGNQGLGGKQVWLRDNKLGNSFYYAHLDSIIAVSGTQVKTGDTLGLVGNTGNAAGGATHLHFGIYSSGGAVDPYPFIRKREIPKSKKTSAVKSFKFIKAGTNIRAGAGTQYEILSSIDLRTPIKVLAFNGLWYHIITSDSKEGWVLFERLLE